MYLSPDQLRVFRLFLWKILSFFSLEQFSNHSMAVWMRLEGKNVKVHALERSWIRTLFAVRFTFFVEQVRIDVMLMGVQEISVNHMLSNEGGGTRREGRNTNRSRSQKQVRINGAPSSEV